MINKKADDWFQEDSLNPPMNRADTKLEGRKMDDDQFRKMIDDLRESAERGRKVQEFRKFSAEAKKIARRNEQFLCGLCEIENPKRLLIVVCILLGFSALLCAIAFLGFLLAG